MNRKLKEENIEIIQFFEQFINDGVLEIPNSVFLKMEKAHAIILNEAMDKARMFKFPEYEIAFFEWLKEEDPLVWKDLWGDVDKPYTASLIFLERFLEKDGRGFPICDLLSTDNYYFTPQMMTDEESKVMIETAKEMFKDRIPISEAQLLSLEVSYGGIDIWHFAYKHKIDLKIAKLAVQQLVDDDALVHLKEAEYLAPFVDF